MGNSTSPKASPELPRASPNRSSESDTPATMTKLARCGWWTQLPDLYGKHWLSDREHPAFPTTCRQSAPGQLLRLPVTTSLQQQEDHLHVTCRRSSCKSPLWYPSVPVGLRWYPSYAAPVILHMMLCCPRRRHESTIGSSVTSIVVVIFFISTIKRIAATITIATQPSFFSIVIHV